MALAACGGGGGGSAPSSTPISPSPPPPPPPPPPPNEAPQLTVEVSPDPVAEAQNFTIDLSNSIDTDGQIVRATVTQPTPIFYPATAVSSPASGVGAFIFRAPEVFRHDNSTQGTRSDLFFQVEIEDDDGSVVTEQVTVNVANVEGATRADGVNEFFRLNLAESVKLFEENTPTTGFNYVFGTRTNSSASNGDTEIILLDEVSPAIWNLPNVTPELLTDTIPDNGPFYPGVFTFDLDPGTNQQFAVINELQNKIYWFAAFDPANPKAHTLDTTIEVDAPCDVKGRTNSGQDTVLIGQRDLGLTVIRLIADRPLGFTHEGFDYQFVSTAAPGRSLCFVYPTRLSLPSPPISSLDDVIAIDFDRHELVLLADRTAPAEVYEVVGTVPIDTDGLSNLEIVDVKSVGAPGSIPNVIWILMSDGRDLGEHRLVMIWQESDGSIMQRPHKFEGGAPAAMQQLKFFPSIPGQLIDFGADIVIRSSTSSEITIFEDNGFELNPTGDMVPVYADPIYVDVGDIPNSASVVQLPFVNGASKALNGVVLSFEAQQELRVYTYMD